MESMIEDAKAYLRERRGKPDVVSERGVSLTNYPRYVHLLVGFCEEHGYTQETYDALVDHFKETYKRTP